MSDDAFRPAADILADIQYGQTDPLPAFPAFVESEGWLPDADGGCELLEIARIVPDPSQPRKVFDVAELARLAESIARRGILQPVRVQWQAEGPQRGLWMLVAGQRRLEAARGAGLTHIPAVRANAALTEAEALTEQIAEQLLRQDWNPIEEAGAYRRLMVIARWSQRELAEQCHLPRSGVQRSLQLLELDPRVQEYVAVGWVKPSKALGLVGLPAARQLALAERIAAASMTAERTAEMVSGAGVAQFGPPPVSALPARCKTPRTVLKIDAGKVIVQAAGDVEAALRKALRAWRRQRVAEPSPAAVDAA